MPLVMFVGLLDSHIVYVYVASSLLADITLWFIIRQSNAWPAIPEFNQEECNAY